MIPLKRVLTKKSKLGFGNFKEDTVENLLSRRKYDILISAYFKLSSITFLDEILDEIGITKEYRIDKPSVDKDMYYLFLEEKKGKLKPRTKNKMTPYREKVLSKAKLQSLNQN